MTRNDVVVLLGSRLADLEHHGTRWRAVLRQWADDERVESLTAVDFPRFGNKVAVAEQRSWLEGCRSLSLQVLGRRRPLPTDRFGWRAASQALDTHLSPSRGQRLTVAVNPVSAPLLARLPTARRCFDAVDDWRADPAMTGALRRVDAGYRAAVDVDAATAVSATLASRLAEDYRLTCAVVGNGVDLPAYAHRSTSPAGLPEGAFAVYVGVVQQRVDLHLLAAAAEVLPTVVAGPVDAAVAASVPSVMWLGPQHVDLLPGLLKRAAVGLLPHHVDSLTTSMDPMKLQEYHAAGLPVVATSLPGLVASDRLRIADDPETFASAVVGAALLPRVAQPVRDWSAVADELLTRYLGEAG